MDQQIRLAHTLTVIIGAWLLAAPSIFGFTNTTAQAISWIVGIVVIVSTIIQAYAVHKSSTWVNWLHMGLAVWLIFSPFILDFYTFTSGTLNQVIVGSLLWIVATWEEGYEVLLTRKWT